MSFKPEIILGPPGTGKTTFLLDKVEEALANGVLPRRIGYVAFTKKAATEAAGRAMERFELGPKDLPNFRTLHSLAFRMLGLTKNQVLNRQSIKEFADIMRLRMSGNVNMEEGTISGNLPGDRSFFLVNLARIRCITVLKQWQQDPDDLPWLEVERLYRGLEKFKQARALIDFTDMLERFIDHVDPPELDLLVVDEAQDLSKMQWRMVMKMANSAKRTIVAGDDDQAIFRWAGADVEFFIKLKGKRTVLGQSYRTPEKVQQAATDLIRRVTVRTSKKWSARDEEGTVNYHNDVSALDMSDGEWLVLSRNNYGLDDAEEQCRREGLFYSRGNRAAVSASTLDTIRAWERARAGDEIQADSVAKILKHVVHNKQHPPKEGVFTLSDLCSNWGVPTDEIWHEAFTKMSLTERSYLTAMLRRGEKLTKEPRIKLSTIHSAKGGEAENVVLHTDMARRTYNGMLKQPEDEIRVFYVGMTRAIKNLHIITPRTKFCFNLL
tara:strand:- start:666 stop:2147 length:1482 start_codon:yes stop_codon:yes gene_type:complete